MNNDINLALFNFVKREDVLLARPTNNNQTSATVSRIKVNKKRINQRKRIKQLFSTSSKSKAAPQQQHNGLIHVPVVPQIGQLYGGGEPPEDFHQELLSAHNPDLLTYLITVIKQIMHFFKYLFTKKPPQVGQIGMVTGTSVNSSEESVDRCHEAHSVSNCDCEERRINLIVESFNIMNSKNMNMELRVQNRIERQQIDSKTYHFMTCPVAAIVPPQAGRTRSESHISICIYQSGLIFPEPDPQIGIEDDISKCDCEDRRLKLVADFLILKVSKNKNNVLKNQQIKSLQQINPKTLHFITCPAAGFSPPKTSQGRSESQTSLYIDQSGLMWQESDEQLEEGVESLLPPMAQIGIEDDVPNCDCENRRFDLLVHTMNMIISKNKNEDLMNQTVRELLQFDPITFHFNTCPAAPASSVTQND